MASVYPRYERVPMTADDMQYETQPRHTVVQMGAFSDRPASVPAATPSPAPHMHMHMHTQPSYPSLAPTQFSQQVPAAQPPQPQYSVYQQHPTPVTPPPVVSAPSLATMPAPAMVMLDESRPFHIEPVYTSPCVKFCFGVVFVGMVINVALCFLLLSQTSHSSYHEPTVIPQPGASDNAAPFSMDALALPSHYMVGGAPVAGALPRGGSTIALASSPFEFNPNPDRDGSDVSDASEGSNGSAGDSSESDGDSDESDEVSEPKPVSADGEMPADFAELDAEAEAAVSFIMIFFFTVMTVALAVCMMVRWPKALEVYPTTIVLRTWLVSHSVAYSRLQYAELYPSVLCRPMVGGACRQPKGAFTSTTNGMVFMSADCGQTILFSPADHQRLIAQLSRTSLSNRIIYPRAQ